MTTTVAQQSGRWDLCWLMSSFSLLQLSSSEDWRSVISGNKFLDAPFVLVAGTIIATIFAIWGGRLLTRIWIAHLSLAEDAKERATMIETFVALVREKIIEPTKADDALKALFRSASTGLTGDASPDTPIEVVTKTITGAKDKS